MRKRTLGKLWQLAKQKSFRLRKEIFQLCFCRRNARPKVLVIVGCQRSGTTLMGNVFAKDLRTAVLQEKSILTRGNDLRLKPYPEVNDLLATFRAPLIVLKPLVESQWTPEILKNIQGAKALWMYRGYKDVVNSNVNRFRSQIEGLRLTLSEQDTTWRSERLSDATLAKLKPHYHENMSRNDAAALGWYRRNILFFELGLDQHKDVLLCRYESFVSKPSEAILEIYRHIGVAPPVYSLAGEIDSESLGLGQGVEIASDIDHMCADLLQRLEACYSQRELIKTEPHSGIS